MPAPNPAAPNHAAPNHAAPNHAAPNHALDPIDRTRAGLYSLLAAALAAPPDPALLNRLATLDGDETPLGQALRQTAEAARTTTPHDAAREYNALFVGVGRGELMPYASFYLTGFLHQRPLARIREDMHRMALEPADGRSDPEDHIATVCEVMSHVIAGLDAAPQSPAQQQMFFDRHLAPWAPRFFADLEAAPSARLYRPIAALGRELVHIDQNAFHLED